MIFDYTHAAALQDRYERQTRTGDATPFPRLTREQQSESLEKARVRLMPSVFIAPCRIHIAKLEYKLARATGAEREAIAAVLANRRASLARFEAEFEARRDWAGVIPSDKPSPALPARRQGLCAAERRAA